MNWEIQKLNLIPINDSYTICKTRQFTNQTYKQFKHAITNVYAIDKLAKKWNKSDPSEIDENLIQGIRSSLTKKDLDQIQFISYQFKLMQLSKLKRIGLHLSWWKTPPPRTSTKIWMLNYNVIARVP